MPKLPRREQKALLKQRIADAEKALEQIEKKEAEEERKDDKRFSGLVGHAVTKELKAFKKTQKEGILTKDVIYRLLDKHIIKGVDRKFLGDYLDMPMEYKEPQRKRKTAKSAASKKSNDVGESKTKKVNVTDINTPSLQRKKAAALTGSQTAQTPLPTLPQYELEDELIADYSKLG